MSTLTRITEFHPGYDLRDSEPGKNYGINGGTLIFVVKGPLGAVHFSMSPGFFPKSAIEHLLTFHRNDSRGMTESMAPMGYDVGYHAKEPQHEGDTPVRESCQFLDGAPCYGSGSGLRAVEWLEEFLEKGTAWLWPKLEEEYREIFGTEGVEG